MKKLLLSIAAGMLMLALPVIASAAVLNSNTFDEYSGYTANITVRGFQSYSTSQGRAMKPFAWTEKADKALTGPKNISGVFNTATSPDPGFYQLQINLNDKTAMEILGSNTIGNKNGTAVISNVVFELMHLTGGLTFSNPNSGTGTEDMIIGTAVLRIDRNAVTGAMILTLTDISAGEESSTPFTSGSPGIPTGNPGWVISPTGSTRMTLPAISISPIMLKPTSGIGYSGPWWNLIGAPGGFF